MSNPSINNMKILIDQNTVKSEINNQQKSPLEDSSNSNIKQGNIPISQKRISENKSETGINLNNFFINYY